MTPPNLSPAALDGPRLPPAAGGKPSSLVVLLHGYGSNGEDLIGLAPFWAKLLPNTQFVAPNAPEPVPGYPGGYQWFPIARLDPRLMDKGVRGAAPSLEKFLDREIARYGVPAAKVALVGFSQGTMMALHVGLRRAPGLAGIIGFSGVITAPETLKAEAKSKPPILLAHGSQDDVIPVAAMFSTAEALCEAGLSAQWHVSHGAPHTIAPDALELGGAFLKAALAGKFA